MTLRLLHLADKNWAKFDGWAASRPFDPFDLTIDRLLNTIYFWATQHASQKDLAKFDSHLWMPPPDIAVTEGPWSPEAETAAFKGLAAALNVKTGPPAPK